MRINHHLNTPQQHSTNTTTTTSKRSNRGSSIKFHPFKLNINIPKPTKSEQSQLQNFQQQHLMEKKPHPGNIRTRTITTMVSKSKQSFIQTAPVLNLDSCYQKNYSDNSLLQKQKQNQNFELSERSTCSMANSEYPHRQHGNDTQVNPHSRNSRGFTLNNLELDYNDMMITSTSRDSRVNLQLDLQDFDKENCLMQSMNSQNSQNSKREQNQSFLQKNMQNFNQVYCTIKNELKSNKDASVEWDKFIYSFNGIFEKLKKENLELKTRLSQAPSSSRCHNPSGNSQRDSIDVTQMDKLRKNTNNLPPLNSSRSNLSYQNIEMQDQILKKNEEMLAQNNELKKQLAEQKIQMQLMNQHFEKQLNAKVNASVQQWQKQIEPQLTKKVKESLQSHYEALFRQRVLEFKAEFNQNGHMSDRPEHFLAVKQSHIHPELLAKIKKATVSECEPKLKQQLKQEYGEKIAELKQSLAQAVSENASKYKSKLKKMLDICNNKLIEQKKKHDSKVEMLREELEAEKSQISRRENRNILISQYEEVLKEKQRIIDQFKTDQDSVMKKLDNLKQQMHNSNQQPPHARRNIQIKEAKVSLQKDCSPSQISFDNFDDFNNLKLSKQNSSTNSTLQQSNVQIQKTISESESDYSLNTNSEQQIAMGGTSQSQFEQSQQSKLHEFNELSKIVNQEFNQINQLQQESIYKEPSMMKDYYSWLGEGNTLHSNSPPHQEVRNKNVPKITNLQEKQQNLFVKKPLDSHQISAEMSEDFQNSILPLPNLCQLGTEQIFESGDVELDHDFEMQIHNAEASEDKFRAAHSKNSQTQGQNELVKNLDFDSISQESTIHHQGTCESSRRFSGLNITSQLLNKTTFTETDRQSLAPSFGAINFDKAGNRLVFLPSSSYGNNENGQHLLHSMGQQNLNSVNPLTGDNLSVFDFKKHKVPKIESYQVCGGLVQPKSTRLSNGEESKLNLNTLQIQSGQNGKYSSANQQNNSTKSDQSSEMNDSETKQLQVGLGLFGRRTMDDSNFAHIESQTSMPTYSPSSNQHQNSEKNQKKKVVKVEPLEVKIYNSGSDQIPFFLTNANKKPVVSANFQKKSELLPFQSELQSQSQGEKYDNLLSITPDESNPPTPYQHDVEVLNQETISLNILQEMQETSTTIAGNDNKESQQNLALLTNWRNVTPSPKISRSRLLNGNISEQVSKAQRNTLPNVESNKENFTVKEQVLNQGQNSEAKSLNRSLSGKILAEKYNQSSKKVSPLQNKQQSQKNDKNELQTVIITPQKPFVLKQKTVTPEQKQFKDSLVNISNIAHYSSNQHLNLSRVDLGDNESTNTPSNMDTLIPARTVQNSEMKNNQTVEKAGANQDLVETERRKSQKYGGNLSILQNLRENSQNLKPQNSRGRKVKYSAEEEFLALESLQDEIFNSEEAEMGKLVGEYQRELQEVREISLKAMNQFNR